MVSTNLYTKFKKNYESRSWIEVKIIFFSQFTYITLYHTQHYLLRKLKRIIRDY